MPRLEGTNDATLSRQMSYSTVSTILKMTSIARLYRGHAYQIGNGWLEYAGYKIIYKIPFIDLNRFHTFIPSKNVLFLLKI